MPKHKTDFDYTALSTFMTCQRKYNYRINRGLVGHAPMTAPDFGKSIHKALDAWYKDKDVTHAITVFKEDFKESDHDTKRTHRMGEWILRNYNEKYQDQPFKVLSTEQEFTLGLPNGNKLIGRIDKVIEWDGVVWGMDHKTTSMLGDSYMHMHTPNLQFSGYTWAIQQLGYPKCQGILVDAILVAKGLLEASSRAKLVPLRRDFAYRSPDDIGEYLTAIQCMQMQIHELEKFEEAGWWMPNWESCTDYGECAYRKICKEPVALREAIIKSEYKVEHWDPRHKEIKE